MTTNELLAALDAQGDAGLEIQLPGGAAVPAHFHVTEVGRVAKDFIDCGGTRRTTAACVLQLWVADDTDHRLRAGKLAGILRRAAAALDANDLPVEVEHDAETVGLYALAAAEPTAAGRTLRLRLAPKRAACLAPDRCGLPALGVFDDAAACCAAGSC